MHIAAKTQRLKEKKPSNIVSSCLCAFVAVISFAFFLFGYGLYHPAHMRQNRTPLTIMFAGDIMLGRQVGKAIQRANDPSLPFRVIFPEIRSADISIGNLECVYADTLITGTYNHKIIRFPAYSEAVEGLKLAGFDCCSLANNHSMDFGTDGVRSTIRTLEKNGIIPAGTIAANPVVIEKKGWTVAMFSYWVNRDSLWVVDPETGYVHIEEEPLLQTVGKVKKTCDIVILFLHWGKEYTGTRSETQRNFAHRAVRAGADLIVGHGPHQIQEIEYCGNSLIAYSLGNCVFDQKYEETQKGLLLRVVFDSTSDRPQSTPLPILIRNDTFVTTLMEAGY